jgi:hypothetical protein
MRLDRSIAVADQVRALCTPNPSSQLLRTTVSDLAETLGRRVAWALAGALAVGMHARPRGTDEVEIVLTGDESINEVVRLTQRGFALAGRHVLRHRGSGIPVRLLTPESIGADPAVFSEAIRSATRRRLRGVGVPVLSRDGLVSVLRCRGGDYDKGDIEVLLRGARPPMSPQAQISVHTT